MNTRNRQLAAALVLALGIGLAAQPAAADVTEAQVVAARTAADHEAIAKAYEADAAAADAKAAEHAAMGAAYRTSGTPKAPMSSMVHHCDRLVQEYRAAAGEYRAMAAEHRKLAAATPK